MEHVLKMKTIDPSANYSIMTPFADQSNEEFNARHGMRPSIADRLAHQEGLLTAESYDVKDVMFFFLLYFESFNIPLVLVNLEVKSILGIGLGVG